MIVAAMDVVGMSTLRINTIVAWLPGFLTALVLACAPWALLHSGALADENKGAKVTLADIDPPSQAEPAAATIRTPAPIPADVEQIGEEDDVFEPTFDLSPNESRHAFEQIKREEETFRASLVKTEEELEADRRADVQTLRRSKSVAPYLSDDPVDFPLLIEEQAPQSEFAIEELPPGEYCDCDVCRPWGWTVLPEGLIYRSYLAGVKESRFASVWLNDPGFGNLWDSTLGGRAGLLRYGNHSAIAPQGLQIDLEGAGMPRLGLEENRRELVSSDFRFGVPITIGDGVWQYKLAYYHLSSHLGDEFMLRTGWERNDFTLDVIVLGASYFPIENVRLYGEAGYAFNTGGGAKPWEFQFGAEFAPAYATGSRGAPFMAVNAHLREEVDFGGYVALQAGWCWRNPVGRLFRVGVQYLNGHSPQYEFFTLHEEQIGAGIWYDF